MAKTDMPAGRKRRRVHRQFWNDDVFRSRIRMLAALRGLSVRAAMREIGFTADYADREMEMRNSNQLMVLADYFGVSPGYLCGWSDVTDSGGGSTRQKGHATEAMRAHGSDATAEYRDWLGKLIIEMVRIAQQGAGDVYSIAERVLSATGLEAAQPLSSSDAASVSSAATGDPN